MVRINAPELRDYQHEAVTACLDAASAGQRRALVVLPTGTGKTVAFAELIRRRGGRALVVAHRDELLAQATERLVAAGIDSERVGRVQASADEVGAEVVVASAQTLARSPRRARLLASEADGGAFATVVVDEAHHGVAPSYKALLDDLDAAVGATGRLVTGWTATPNRVGLKQVFGEAVFRRDLVDMIGAGWLSDLKGRRVAARLDLGSVRRSHGDYSENALVDALTRADMPELVAESWTRFAEGRQSLVFVPGVKLAHKTAKALRARGVAAGAVDGAMALEDRSRVLDRYRSGKLAVLVNCAVLTEGVDLPETSCIVVARPTLSPLLYAQMVGRGTRLAPGKADCLVLDLVGASDMHDLDHLGQVGPSPMTLGSLAGLSLEDDTSLLDAALADRDHRDRLAALLGDHARLVADDAELFGRRRLRWLTLPGDHPTHVLSAGDAGHVVVVAEPAGTWGVHLVAPRAGEGAAVLGSGLTLDGATGVAEHEVLRRHATHLVSVDAAWRQRPATERQLAFLVKARRVPADVASTLTRGQAADLIDGTIAARRLAEARARGQLA